MKRWGKKFEDKRDWVKYNSKLIKRGTWFFDYRSIQGICQSLANKILGFPVNHYSNVCRRINDLTLTLPEIDFDKPIYVGNDGSGIKVSNRGEWMRQKWQVRRGWIKAVITMDVENKKLLEIEVFEKGDSEPDIFERHIKTLIKKGATIKKACGDGAHDKRKLFNTLEKYKIEQAIKIRSNASTKARGSISRAREVRKYKELGYEKWVKEKKYGMRWATEGKFSSIKRKFGEYVRSTKKNNMIKEAERKFVLYEKMMTHAEA
ncbi:MAG: IS5 family transposase [Nanoarchaeota archaeon]|nr:IS5 family transposase [Nanoarchaeota archaeon]MBU1269809.1 IS5 family transposase [Nanoarchaeota archaeon]MBU1604280.1 IS5 family transposase [Nanoarchaeota archaeon]MBU2442446.1 IS5 family transposase [Nanoarchaeota archaeon]